jgi:hypothetical protein
MRHGLRLFAVALFAALLLSSERPALAMCAAIANSCSSLDDCIDPLPMPCEDACVDFCSAMVQYIECVSGTCWCVCDGGGLPN